MRRVKQEQLSFVFADRSKEGNHSSKTKGEPEAKEWLRRIAKLKELQSLTARAVDENQLLEQTVSMANIAGALLNVVQNKGSAGEDGVRVEEVIKNVQSFLTKLHHELISGKYRPGNIRRVWIPKPGGGKRGLGIPNVVDRVVQQAVLQTLEPIFEPYFHNSSHGFRPNRGAYTAIAEAKKNVSEGYKVVVDIDLSKFFDRVNHQRLLNRLAQKVKDGRILKLIHSMLKAKVIMPDGAKIAVYEGTPQGGPLSPLLSNIVLDELDKELERRGLRFVRYADDCRIFVRSIRAGERVMNSIRKFIEKRLRLKINEEKSSVISIYRSSFLGFKIINKKDELQVHLSKRSIERIYRKIKELTPRTWGRKFKSCIEQINQYLKGWEGYFGPICNGRASLFKHIDAHVRRRLRAIIIRHKKRGRILYRHLISCGVSSIDAGLSSTSNKGYWYRSNTPGICRAYKNKWFERCLFSVYQRWKERHADSIRALYEQLLLPLDNVAL